MFSLKFIFKCTVGTLLVTAVTIHFCDLTLNFLVEDLLRILSKKS